MKKRLSLLLCVLLTTLSVSARVITQGAFVPNFGEGTYGGSWYITNDKVLHVEAVGVIPFYHEEKAPWYKFKDDIQTLEIGNEVTTINVSNFYNLNKLTTIIGGENVQLIRNRAFEGCSVLQSVSFPNVKGIWYRAFRGCLLLKKIFFPNVTEVDKEAFYQCKNLRQVILPKVKIIRANAFAGKHIGEEFYPVGNLQYIDLGSDIELLERCCLNNDGLWNTAAAPSVFISNPIPPHQEQEENNWEVENYNDPTYAKYTFGRKPIGEGKRILVAVPSGYYKKYSSKKILGETGFFGVSGYGINGEWIQQPCGSLVIGAPIYEGDDIAGWWYYDGANIHVDYEGELPVWDDLQAPWADELGHVGRLVLHDGITSIPDKAFINGKNLQGIHIITLPNHLEHIGKQAFEGCREITDVYSSSFNNRNITIGASAFRNCTALSWFSAETYDIGINAFENCRKLGKFSSAPTIVENNTFIGCSSLAKIDLANAKKIGDNAFTGCSTLSEITFGSTTPTIGNSAFAGCTSLSDIFTSCEVPSAVSSSTFEGVTLSNITLHVSTDLYPDYEVHNIWGQMKVDREFVFPATGTMSNGTTWSISEESKKLTVEGNIPDFNKVSDQPWYQYRDYIHEIEIKNGATKIGNYAFAFSNSEDSHVERVTIPLTCESIGQYAFQNCDKLVTLDVGYTNTVGSYAFSGCSSLRRIIFTKNLKQLGDYILENCVSLEEIINKTEDPAVCTAYTFANINSNVELVKGRNGAPLMAGSTSGQGNIVLDVPESSYTKYLADKYWRLFSFKYVQVHGGIVTTGPFSDGLWVLYSDGTLVLSANENLTTDWGFCRPSTSGTTESQIASVKHVQILGNMTYLGNILSNLPNLETVELPASVKRLYCTFTNCPKLKNINLTEVENIDYRAFMGCGLTNVDLPKTKIIGEDAFWNCKSLQTVNLPCVEKVKTRAFGGCAALTSIDFSKADLSAAIDALNGCTSLREVKLGGATIPDKLFKNCTALESVDLGKNIRYIGVEVFSGSGIKTIYCQNAIPVPIKMEKRSYDNGDVTYNYDTYAFADVNLPNVSLYLPTELIHLYRKADYWQDMNILKDESYQPLLPISGPIGENGVWRIDENGTMTIDCNGSMYFSDNGNSWKSTFDPWMPLVSSVVVGDRTTTLTNDVTDMDNPDLYRGVESLTLGASMTTIRNNAVRYSGLKNVYCYAVDCPSMVTSEENSSFDWNAINENQTTLHVVKGCLSKYQNDYRWKKFPKIVADLEPRVVDEIFQYTTEDGVEMCFRVTDAVQKTCEVYEPDGAPNFSGEIVIPSTAKNGTKTYTVTAIGEQAFFGCTELTDVTIPATITSIGEQAFYGCTSLQKMRIETENPPTAPDNAFEKMYKDGTKLFVPADTRFNWITRPWWNFIIIDPAWLSIMSTGLQTGMDMSQLNEEDVMTLHCLNILGIIEYEYDGTDGYVREGSTGRMFATITDNIVTMSDELEYDEYISHFFSEKDRKLLEEKLPEKEAFILDKYKSASLSIYVEVIEDDIFLTAQTKEGATVTFHVTDREAKTCEVSMHFNEGTFAIDDETTVATIPSQVEDYTVTGVGIDACRDRMNLTTLTLPATIREIGVNAFFNCGQLTNVYMLRTTPPTLMNWEGMDEANNAAFEGVGANVYDPTTGMMGGTAKLHVRKGSRKAYNVYPWNEWFLSKNIVEDIALEDVNGDGKFDLEDITTLIASYLNSEDGYDLDGDGVLSINDITLLITKYLEK